MTINRREFLRRFAAGSATVAVPALLPGCATQPEPVVEQPVPDNVFSSWFGLDQDGVSQLVSRLSQGAPDLADAFFQVARHNRIVFENGAVSDALTSTRQGAAFRVVSGGQTGFATTPGLEYPALMEAARAASSADAGAAEIALPMTIVPSRDLYPTGIPWSAVTQDRKVQLLELLEQKVRARESAVESVTVRWDDAQEDVMIATADGRLMTDMRPLTRVTLIVTATQGAARQSGFSGIAVRDDIDLYDEQRLDALVTEALERTMIQFEARRAPSGDMPVILAAGAGGVLLHEALGHHLEADFVENGSSALSGKLGEAVADPMVTVVEDTAMPREPGALNFDDEGVATGRTVLVENGKLRSFIHDMSTARRAGVEPTGSGRRGSFEHQPTPRLTSTSIENGPHAREEIIQAVDRGVICETFSGGQADMESGSFTFTVKNGWLVEKGRITGPTKDFRISGSGADLLGGITMLGNDSRMDPAGWICGKHGHNLAVSHGAPTTLVSSLSVTPI
jgi:TldD protein